MLFFKNLDYDCLKIIFTIFYDWIYFYSMCIIKFKIKIVMLLLVLKYKCA